MLGGKTFYRRARGVFLIEQRKAKQFNAERAEKNILNVEIAEL
jgi:hypothetical protein